MKVFVTGGTGYIGSAVSLRLKKAGHDVQALVRNKEKASALQAAGVKLVQGDLGNPAGYSAAAYGAQAIVHCASDSGPQSVELDRKSIQNARELLHGRVGATFIYTSGIWVLGDTAGAVVDESRPTDPAKIVAWRPAHEQLALELAKEGIRSVVVRPGIVYGGARGGIPASFFGTALKQGASQTVGDGANHWPLVHVDDLAELYVRLVERAPAGSIFHGTDASTRTVREIAEAASRAAGKDGKVTAVPLEKARSIMGPFADALALDQKVSSEKARTELEWRPRHEDFVAEAPQLFAQWQSAQ
ncbi:MAG: NAD-dependent epimerase/dehydratase family protein [Deltaproteobacteria bacterium]|nr:MAG: NAD-dependent epimerase/dehydratase family protein [Deltaproteobacteria bacterium]